jgi:hypothetical protein
MEGGGDGVEALADELGDEAADHLRVVESAGGVADGV